MQGVADQPTMNESCELSTRIRRLDDIEQIAHVDLVAKLLDGSSYTVFRGQIPYSQLKTSKWG